MTPAQKTALEWAIAHLTDDGAHRLAPVHMATLHSLLSSSDEVTRLQVRVAELEQRNTNLSKIIDGLPTFCHHCGASLGED